MPMRGEAKPDWWIISEVAKRMGQNMGWTHGFDYRSPREIFDEHARLSTTENSGSRGFDIGGLAGLTDTQFDALEPVQWPLPRTGHPGTPRLFENSRFGHPDGKARFVPTPPRPPVHALEEEFPLVLNTGRVRDQWHTMTRTGQSPRLGEHAPEPFVDLHAQDALLAGVRVGELGRVTTRWGSLIGRIRASGEIARGTMFVPIHWNAEYASEGRAGTLVNPVVDPLSGEPEFKHTPARVDPFLVDWYGFAFSQRPIERLDAAWWTLVRGSGFLRYELAGRGRPDWVTWARGFLDAADPDADYFDYEDAAAGVYRAVHMIDDRVAACVYVSRRPELPSRALVASLFARRKLTAVDRITLLAGRLQGQSGQEGVDQDPGPLVCSCFGVGRNTICRAIAKHDLTDPREVGARLRAGTNCGSCLPEIKNLLSVAHAQT
jgi:assimilatory nitrate reductase catalytic subunit